jgi:hypothetical protein
MSDGRRVPFGYRNYKIQDDGSQGSDEGCSLAEELDDYLFQDGLGWAERASAAVAVGTAISMGVGTAGSTSRASAVGRGTHEAVGTASAHSDAGARGNGLGLSVGTAGGVSDADGTGGSTSMGTGTAQSTSSAEAGSLVILQSFGANCPRARKLEGALKLIERYEADAVAACFADGIGEPGLIRERIRQARNRAKERLCQRSSSASAYPKQAQ